MNNHRRASVDLDWVPMAVFFAAFPIVILAMCWGSNHTDEAKAKIQIEQEHTKQLQLQLEIEKIKH